MNLKKDQKKKEKNKKNKKKIKKKKTSRKLEKNLKLFLKFKSLSSLFNLNLKNGSRLQLKCLCQHVCNKHKIKKQINLKIKLKNFKIL